MTDNIKLQQEIKRFELEAGIKLKFINGNPYYGYDLFLERKYITKIPDNLTINGYLYLGDSNITKLPENLTVKHSLNLIGTKITELPDSLKVGRNIDLRYTKIKKLPENLSIKGFLDLEGTPIEELPKNLEVGDYLDLKRTKIKNLPENLVVGRYLGLEKTLIKELPKNLVVGESLYLNHSQILKLPNNLIIGKDLILSYTNITELPDNLLVYETLDISHTGINEIPENLIVSDISCGYYQKINKDNVNKNVPEVLHWKFENKHYIKADGILSEVISKKGNVYKVRNIGKTNIQYLVTDVNDKWAHGETLQKAKEDLIYKISKRDTSKFKNLSLDDTLSFEEAIEAYRVITGSCSAGTKDFVEKRLPKPHKKNYTIREIIKLTKGEYQSKVFKRFFEKDNLSS